MNSLTSSTHYLAAGALCRGVNHVLASEPWAMAELSPHVGKSICLNLPMGQMAVEITPQGKIAALSSTDQASLLLEVSAQALSGLLASSGNLRDQAFKAVKISGDADLAQLIGRLVSQVRWEYEEDLAKWVGDAPANFAVRQAKTMVKAGQAATKDFLQNVVEYVSEERKILLNKRDFMIRKNELNELRDSVDRIEKRIALLEQKTK
jgi:ubiquinone biosynthesis protein UbiJ